MEISGIEIIPIKIPTIDAYSLSFGTVTAATSVIIKLYTDNGTYGIGDTSPCPMFSYESSESVVGILQNYLFPAIKGMDPYNIEHIHKAMDEAVKGNPFAKAAIDIALYDIIGKLLNIPIYKLLGGCFVKKLPLLWPLLGSDAETNVKEATKAIKRGFKSIMIKVGQNVPDVDIERVSAVRKAIGEEIIIIVDANQGWTRSTAIKCIRKMEPFNIAWIEQPVPRWDIDGMKSIKDTVSTPISVDEGLCSLNDAIAIIKGNAVDIASIKLQKSGGFCKAKKIAAIMEAGNIPIFINSMIETGGSVSASLHFAVSIPNAITFSAALMSTLRLKDDITKEGSLLIKDGFILVTDKPGLGIELDQKKIDFYTYC